MLERFVEPMSALSVAGVVAVAAFIVLAYARAWHWTGFRRSPAREGTPGEASTKTLWDWMQLLVVPFALVAIGFALNAAQNTREEQRENKRVQEDRAIALDR